MSWQQVALERILTLKLIFLIPNQQKREPNQRDQINRKIEFSSSFPEHFPEMSM